MAAEYATLPAPLPLLLPPDKPAVGVTRTVGWRWKAGTRSTVLVRRLEDDAHGAIVQWIVLRYYRDGVLRKTLAREYGYSIRCVQEYLSGKTSERGVGHWFAAYAAPVLRAMTRLGIPNIDTRCNKRKRLETQLAASRAAIASMAHLLTGDDRPEARRLLRDVQLLTTPGRVP